MSYTLCTFLPYSSINQKMSYPDGWSVFEEKNCFQNISAFLAQIFKNTPSIMGEIFRKQNLKTVFLWDTLYMPGIIYFFSQFELWVLLLISCTWWQLRYVIYNLGLLNTWHVSCNDYHAARSNLSEIMSLLACVMYIQTKRHARLVFLD